MIKRHYSGAQRRALNIIWNAAGRYDFETPFMAFYPNGKPDFYFNMVIGLVDKWLDLQKISDFFYSYSRGSKTDEYDALLWLGLENCVYEKELPTRPILSQLRRRRAEDFFKVQQSLSRQQMMLQSMLVYNEQQARWALVTGRKMPLLSAREKKMEEALRFPGSLDTEQVIERMQAFLLEFFRFRTGEKETNVRQLRKGSLADKVLRKVLHHETRQLDVLLVRTGTGHGDREGSVRLLHNQRELHNSADAAEDLAYIRSCFGPCIYNEADMRVLENDLCKEDDAYCRLWITKAGDMPSAASSGGAQQHRTLSQQARVNSSDNRSAKDVAKDIARQREKNIEYYRRNGMLIAGSVRRLSAQMDTIFASYAQPLPVKARAGRLNSEKAYRLAVMDDPYVFERPGDEVEHDLSVDILLDASASRLNSQEEIASQAYVIAKSLEKCHVPVQVSAFRSLRGYTVLQLLKQYKDARCEGIFGYYAAGWNRDGLALKTAAAQMYQNSAVTYSGKKILLILTDASPNDSTRMPAKEGSFFEREYEGEEAVRNTAEAVKSLRSLGIRTAAIYLGPNTNLENLHLIYGKEYVRIQKIEQLANGVSELLQMILREIRN